MAIIRPPLESIMASLHPVPHPTAVLAEQARTIGLSLRTDLWVGGAFAVIVLIDLIGKLVSSSGQPFIFSPDNRLPLALFGVLAPFALWRGDKVFGDSRLWTRPVERRRHALLKVAAGWCWLLAATFLLLAYLLVLALLSGGSIGVEETRIVYDGAAWVGVPWATPAWQWLVPVLSTTVPYLLGTAVVLGLEHPFRWLAAVAIGLVLLAAAGPDGMAENILASVFGGPFGLDTALSAGTETHGFDPVHPPAVAPPEDTVSWDRLPTFGAWATAFAAWLIGSLALVWLAASRHRD
jgi:hypothetical protein